MNKIGIIGAGTGALPPEVLRMAEESNVEIVELDKDFSPTDIPQFEDRVYTNSHLLFAAQYVSFKDAGLEELFWNIVTWYHFFRHFEEFTCKIQWYVSKDMVAYIFIRNLADWSTKSICFNDKPCPLVQVTENLDCYKQVDGAIYEISNGSPVE